MQENDVEMKNVSGFLLVAVVVRECVALPYARLLRIRYQTPLPPPTVARIQKYLMYS